MLYFLDWLFQPLYILLPSPISIYDDIVMADFGLNMIVIDGGIKFWGKIKFYPKT